MAQSQERRRDYTVSRPVQVIYMMTWLGSIALLLTFAGLAWNCYSLNEKLGEANLNILGMNGLLLLGVMAFVLVAIALGLGVYTIIHTHRMVGSSYRIKMVLQALRQGDWSQKASLRDGDYFLDVAQELNQYIDENAPAKGSGDQEATST